MDKSPEAFRTISEVAEALETPAHVLRFWESRFPQIRPVKRAGGRRYYRPTDIALLTGIKRLLHDEGLTIRGVQKILREQGVRHVAGLTGTPEGNPDVVDAHAALEDALTEGLGAEPQRADINISVAEVETAQVFALETALRKVSQDAALKTADLFDILVGTGGASAPLSASSPETPKPFGVGQSAPDSARQDGHPVAADQNDPEPELASLARQTAPVPPEPILVAPALPTQTYQTEAAPAQSWAALLRALPAKMDDDLLGALQSLRDRIAAHRDRLIMAADSSGNRG